jgi:hypothetical protein
MVLSFTARASETGKLYGSITAQMIAESISEKTGVEINRRQVYTQPLRALGEHTVQIRLTVDLIPEVTVIVNSEGEEQETPEMQQPVKPSGEEDDEEVQDEEQVESPGEAEEQETPVMQEPVKPNSEEDEEEVQDEEQFESPGEAEEQETPVMQEPVKPSSEEDEEEIQEQEQVETPDETDDQEQEPENEVVEETAGE